MVLVLHSGDVDCVHIGLCAGTGYNPQDLWLRPTLYIVDIGFVNHLRHLTLSWNRDMLRTQSPQLRSSHGLQQRRPSWEIQHVHYGRNLHEPVTLKRGAFLFNHLCYWEINGASFLFLNCNCSLVLLNLIINVNN